MAEGVPSSVYSITACWCPRPSVVFNVLLSARITAAFLSNISDCDETFNYWEPTHYLMYGKGFQTWEYSPEYAIRSYGYILLHVLPAELVRKVFEANKLVVFYYIRFMLAVICAACETYFYKGVVYQFGEHVARILFVLLIFNTGMFISAAAYLPSSFSMYACLIAFGGWFSKNYPVAIFGIALGSLVGWPFCAVLGIPIAYDVLIRQRRVWFFIEWALGSFAAIMIPLVAVDSHYYGKQVITPMNIVLYNVFGQGGPNLYGVEPWWFYCVNCFLNFNITCIMALISLPLAFVLKFLFEAKTKDGFGCHIPAWIALSPMYIWALIFFTRPHKEERFLFPIYPFICLAASITMSYIQEIYHYLFTRNDGKHHSSSSNWLATLMVIVSSMLCLSRSSALYKGYHGPLDLYADMFNEAHSEQPAFHAKQRINICVGKEWYRYPSSFFLPSQSWNLTFIKSDFGGQLPKPYESGADATRIIPSYMNEMNREEATRYGNIKHCDLFIDLDLQNETPLEPNYSKQKNRWDVLFSKKFLDTTRSSSLFRAFYVPFISEKYTTYASYNILRLKKKRRKLKPDTDD